MNPIIHALASWQDNLRFFRIRKKYKIAPGGRRTRLTLLFTPDRPVPSSVVHKLCALTGCRMITHPSGSYDLVFRYRDATFYEHSVESVPDNAPMVNRHIKDISKKNVDRVFNKVFGYSLMLDPTLHRGKAVEKSDANAQHDGRIIQCPIPESSLKPDCVYQRIISNQSGNNQVRDLRVVVHGEQFPLVYQKYRPLKTRFSNTNTRVEIGEPNDLFSKEERKKILLFTRDLGLDYGELDILRDRDSKKIYIVDANLTPWGPPNGLSFADQKRALEKLTDTFYHFMIHYSNRDSQTE